MESIVVGNRKIQAGHCSCLTARIYSIRFSTPLREPDSKDNNLHLTENDIIKLVNEASTIRIFIDNDGEFVLQIETEHYNIYVDVLQEEKP